MNELVRNGWFVTVAIAGLAACGGGGDTTTDAGVAPLCGQAGTKTGTECTSTAQCGSGAENVQKVVFCEHCFARADTHVCEAGTCRAMDTSSGTNIGFRFTYPTGVTGVQSFTVAALNPIMADGTRLTCDALKSTCMFVDNSTINARNSRFSRTAEGRDTYIGQILADAGSDRLLFIQLTTGLQGNGEALAQGCVSGINVPSGQTTEVVVELTPL